jgi:hypothetical protein
VEFRAELSSAQESALQLPREFTVECAICVSWAEVHQYLCISSVSPDFLRCHCGKKGIRPFDFDKASPGVEQMQPSPCYAPESQHLTSSLLGRRLEVT